MDAFYISIVDTR
ncbi:hypothetical protein PDE_02159 [Penicillium oxalicum 114-2]|uniref:Uncharacterized protein n=1 Tax=Penicillium oxalicum (strain 114-2 / CGMCC 5302) TaxID=933388 RepID=S7ZEV6_PENO1|nr:hypothetical protein PDE_02159 [Penicillium oxalicum 114-2]